MQVVGIEDAFVTVKIICLGNDDKFVESLPIYKLLENFVGNILCSARMGGDTHFLEDGLINYNVGSGFK